MPSGTKDSELKVRIRLFTLFSKLIFYHKVQEAERKKEGDVMKIREQHAKEQAASE
jgi:hypothetical protein